jgi:hypothetical protein
LKIGQIHYQNHQVGRGWIEADTFVKYLGFRREGLDEDSANAYGVGGLARRRLKVLLAEAQNPGCP